jgi:hypothetical protein
VKINKKYGDQQLMGNTENMLFESMFYYLEAIVSLANNNKTFPFI